MPTAAASYLRVSGASQVEGDGFPRQRQAIERFARANSYDLVAEYRDEGASGRNELDDREGLSALLEGIAGNGIRVVIIENASRLARDLLVQEAVLDRFRTLSVAVIGADGTDLTVADGDPTRVLIRQILGAVAQFDKAMIVAKLRAARDRKRREAGRCDGAKPFGDLDGEVETLDRIRQLRRKPRRGPRLSFGEVAAILNQEQRQTRHGRRWARGTVHALCKRLRLS
jgi:DNA invertase Pin-like site-specific DNA recombinase